MFSEITFLVTEKLESVEGDEASGSAWGRIPLERRVFTAGEAGPDFCKRESSERHTLWAFPLSFWHCPLPEHCLAVGQVSIGFPLVFTK